MFGVFRDMLKNSAAYITLKETKIAKSHTSLDDTVTESNDTD